MGEEEEEVKGGDAGIGRERREIGRESGGGLFPPVCVCVFALVSAKKSGL